ncbi:MFS transporter [Streptomyces sp. NPDC086777]|uniref:MFS transporter n=1 Tax=Streptomyces sp. NPDC086777 TaxID=3154866 RepID=UPI00344E4568
MATTPEDLSATPDTSDGGAQDSTHSAASSPTGRQRSRASAVCVAAAFLTLLDVSIVTVALPSMEHQLAMSSAEATWAVAGYTLTFGLALIPGGRLGDEFGRRRVLLVGMTLFTITGVLCGLASSAAWLVAARLARGVAAGLIAPQVVGLIHQMYRPGERGRAFGYYGAAVSLSTAIGPLWGGVILQGFGTAEGWRWIFFLFIPFDLAVLPLAFRLLPESRRATRPSGLDLVGAFTLGVAVAALMLPLLQTGPWGTRRWWLTWIGFALLAVFVLWERTVIRGGRRPLVDVGLFKERAYWVGVLVAGALYGGFTGIFIVLAQFLQQGVGYSPLEASLCTVLFTVGSAVCGVVSGRLVHRAGRLLVIVGTALTAIGLALTAQLVGGVQPGDNIMVLVGFPLLVAGCGAGLVIAANQTLALDSVPRREGSTAAGVYQTGMKIGTSLGTALASSFYFSQLVTTHRNFPAAARSGLLCAAALAAFAFLVALPGLTLSVRKSLAPGKVGVAEVTRATTSGQDV